MLRDLADAPHAVYRAYDQADRLLYVGITCDPDVRLDAHARGSVWAAEYDHHTLTWVDSKAEAEAAEIKAIRAEDPVHNVRGRLPQPHARLTLNLPPDLYRELQRWATAAAAAIDVPRVSIQDALRAMIQVGINDTVAAKAVLQLLRDES